MSFSWKKITVCAAAVSALALGAAPAMRPAALVKAGKVVGVKRSIAKKYMGTITGVEDVALVPRVSGVIWKQCFANGDMVKKGQVLFELENTSYLAQRDAAKAKLAQCRAEYTFAERNLKRLASLWKSRATSESSYEEAVRMEASAKAALAGAEASLRDAENLLSYTTIKSPIDGKAGKAALSPYNYVTPSTGALVSVVHLDELYVNFWISARDYLTMFGSYSKLQSNADIKIVLADDSIYNAPVQVVFLDNRIDKDTDTIRVRGLVKNADLKLIPDSLVTVILARKENAPVSAVPVSAVMNDGKHDYVYVIDSANTVSRRNVSAGELQGNLQVIDKGVNIGEIVVVEGTHKVYHGGKVNPVMSDTESK